MVPIPLKVVCHFVKCRNILYEINEFLGTLKFLLIVTILGMLKD